MAEPESNPPLSRRERLKREREERILNAAATVFSEKGFHQATIREIADLADVADGTIYNYFADKFDLLIGLLSRLAEVDRLQEELTQAQQKGAQAFFEAAFRQRLNRIMQAEKILQALLPEVLVNRELRQRFYQQYVSRLTSLLEQYLRQRIEQGHIRPVHVPLTVRIIQSMLIGLLFVRILGDEPLGSQWEKVPQVLTALLFDGLNPREEKDDRPGPVADA